MDNKSDQEMLDELFQAYLEMEVEMAEQQEKMEQKLFSAMSLPYQLGDILPRYTKAQLDNIRKTLDLKNLSSLNKQALIAALVEQIPDKAEVVFNSFDDERYQLAKKIATNKGFTFITDMAFEQVSYFLERGVMFPGIYEGKRVLSMPTEIVEIFQQSEHKQLRQLAKRNTEWIKLSYGLLYYYGVLDMITLMDMVAEYTQYSIDDGLDFIHVLYDAMEYDDQIYYDHHLRLVDRRVVDPDLVIDEQQSRADIDYYPFTRQQILRAGEPAYVEKFPERNKLMSFLLGHYKMTRLEAEELVEECIQLILLDKSTQEMLSFFEGILEFASMDEVAQLMELCTNLHNQTRMWILKGHTPNELFQIEQKRLNPLPTIPVANSLPLASPAPKAQVIDFQTRKKIGRNDPCPCGSGRKFKHCCG